MIGIAVIGNGGTETGAINIRHSQEVGGEIGRLEG
jgi:hypothetical protein